MTTKTLKTVKTATYFDAGYEAGVSDGRTQLIVSAIADDKVEQALAEYTEGYVFGSITVALPKMDIKAARELARSIMEGVNPDAKTTPEGKIKCTPEQWNWRRNGAQRFNRVRRKLGAPAANNSGGARDKSTGEAPKAEKLPKAANPAEANAHVRNIALMLSTYVSKNKDHVSAELSGLVAEFVGKLNKLT